MAGGERDGTDKALLQYTALERRKGCFIYRSNPAAFVLTEASRELVR